MPIFFERLKFRVLLGMERALNGLKGSARIKGELQ